MKLRTALAALTLALATGGCTTADLNLLDSALSLYSDVAYLNGDCPYNLQKYRDRDGHHHCSISDESPATRTARAIITRSERQRFARLSCPRRSVKA